MAWVEDIINAYRIFTDKPEKINHLKNPDIDGRKYERDRQGTCV